MHEYPSYQHLDFVCVSVDGLEEKLIDMAVHSKVVEFVLR
jgi:hypothetical protein